MRKYVYCKSTKGLRFKLDLCAWGRQEMVFVCGISPLHLRLLLAITQGDDSDGTSPRVQSVNGARKVQTKLTVSQHCSPIYYCKSDVSGLAPTREAGLALRNVCLWK